MPDAELFKDSFDFTVGDDRFVFRIPTFADELKIGFEARKLRRELDPGGVGDPAGLDYSTFAQVQTVAIMKVLLKQSSAAKWLYTESEGSVEIDYTKWPADKVQLIQEVGVKFNDELARFRSPRTPDKDGDGGKDLATQPNSESQPV